MSASGSLGDLLTGGRILVVDDQESNRQLLRDLLELDGHTVVEAADGMAALRLAAAEAPDVVLLDVSMPGIDGFEVCRRLRAAPDTAATPILLVTALDQREHRLQGVAAGANDYIVKPIDRSEVALRVRNAVRMRAMHRLVEEQFHRLQELELMRDELVNMVAHDLRSPLTGLRGLFDVLRDHLGPTLPPKLSELMDDGARTVDQFAGLIGDMLDVSRMESDRMPLRAERVDVERLAFDAVRMVAPVALAQQVTLAVDGGSVVAVCDPTLIHRVIVNLVANALRFSASGKQVRVSVAAEGDGVRVGVHDQGPGIPLDQQGFIFEKFGQLPSPGARRGRTSGLGLTFCRLVLDRHGGRIGVESVPGAGSEFWFWLPGDSPPLSS